MSTQAHTTKVNMKALMTLGMALALVMAFGFQNEARAEGFLMIGGSSGGHHGGYSVPGHYETRYQTVMVAPAYAERQWVAPQYQTLYDRFGNPCTIQVRAGYWTEVCVPAQYQTRAVQVWVPGYCATAPRYSPDVALRVGFRF